MKNMKRGIPSIFKEGVRQLSGVEQAVIRNCSACKDLANLTKTSFGPHGMNKMIINHLGKMFVTSDTTTILTELEVDHPAAKLLVMAAAMQEIEIGDGSNYLLSLGGELLGQAEELITMGLSTNEIIPGYIQAAKKAIEYYEDLVVLKVEQQDMFNKDVLKRCIKTAIASKQFGYEEQLSSLVAEACLTVMPKNVFNFNVDNIRVVKVLGSHLAQSEVVHGMILQQDTIGQIKMVENAKVAVYSCDLSSTDTETKGTILIENAEQLMDLSAGEEQHIEKIIKTIHSYGVNVIVTGGSVDDIALHYCEKYGIMVIKMTSKFELRRICKAVKARPLVQIDNLTVDDIGHCSKIYVREVGSSKLTILQQQQQDQSQIATILLRASTSTILNDLERAIDDGVNTVKAMTKDSRFICGGSSSDVEVARRLSSLARSSSGLEQYSIQKFAESLEIIAQSLAENSGNTSMEVLSKLYAEHEKGNIYAGVDVQNGGIADMKQADVLDLLSAKIQAIKLLIEVVCTILRVDQIIQAKPAGGPKMPKNNGHWDDNDD